MILLVALLIGGAFHVARVRGWSPAVALHRRWQAARPDVFAYVRASPATFTYLFTLGATLVAAGGLQLAIHAGVVSRSQERSIDVGVSYGFAAVAAVFTYRLTGRARYAWGGVLLSTVVVAASAGRTFTDFGHLVAVLIGFSLWPLTRRPNQELAIGSPVWAMTEPPTT